MVVLVKRREGEATWRAQDVLDAISGAVGNQPGLRAHMHHPLP